jgi:DNA-binding transcriptional MerR regulator
MVRDRVKCVYGKHYQHRQGAKLLGVSVKTLQRWEREGRLIPVARTDSNRRLYTETQIREFKSWTKR